METTQKNAASFKGIRSAGWVIVICFIIAVLIFALCVGKIPPTFMNNDPNNHPLPGNFLGTIYKGWIHCSCNSNAFADCHRTEY